MPKFFYFIFFLKASPDPNPRTTRTKTTRTQTQIRKHKPRNLLSSTRTLKATNLNFKYRTHVQIFKYFLTLSCQPNTKTQTDLQQEHKPSSRSLLSAKHKNTNRSPAITQIQTQQQISRQPNTKQQAHTQKSARNQTQIQTQTHQSIFSNNPTIQTQNHNDQ